MQFLLLLGRLRWPLAMCARRLQLWLRMLLLRLLSWLLLLLLSWLRRRGLRACWRTRGRGAARVGLVCTHARVVAALTTVPPSLPPRTITLFLARRTCAVDTHSRACSRSERTAGAHETLVLE